MGLRRFLCRKTTQQKFQTSHTLTKPWRHRECVPIKRKWTVYYEAKCKDIVNVFIVFLCAALIVPTVVDYYKFYSRILII